MYARSTTITGDSGSIDALIAYIRDESMPAITALDGCIGLSLVVDRDSGRCIATSSWQSQESMRASADSMITHRRRAVEIMGGEPEVSEWEVAVMHRAHTTAEGCCCRITWVRPTDLDATVDTWHDRILPRAEAMDGFCSASLLIDRTAGIGCGTVTFDSRPALEASREMAAAMREQGARNDGVEFLDVGEFELAVAHLRLPELV